MALPKHKIVPDFDLKRLTPNPDNPRTITRDGRKALADSLSEFGMLETIVANKRADGSLMVLGGHQRLQAMLDAGETTGPVVLVRVDETAEKRLNLMLNGHNGRWEPDMLASILGELGEKGCDLKSLGLDGVAGLEQAMVGLKDAAEFQERQNAADSSETREVDVDGMELLHRCPRCGFEFDNDTAADGRRTAPKARKAAAAEKAADADDETDEDD